MAKFIYIDINGQQRSIEAPDAQAALSSAVNIAPNSGVALDPQSVVPVSQSPVTRQGVDLSLVGDVGNIVPTPTTPAPTTANASFVAPGQRLNAQGEIIDPTPQEIADFNSRFTTTRFNEDASGLGRIGSDISSVRNEIATIEARMANRASDRNAALEGAGVFEDMRRLNELNAQLRAAQDRQIEVPIEQRQALRGRGATFSEFEQATRPELESAALRELTTSRASARLTDAVNTNIQVIDTRLKAEADRDDFIYEQKQNYLNTLETNYANILTEQQKLELEDRKFANELTRDAINAERAAKQKQLDLAAERGATPAELNRLFNSSLDEIYGWNSNKALELGDNTENVAVQQSAIDIVGLIDEILSNETGLKSSVGSTSISRTRAGNIPILGLLGGPISAGLEAVTGVSPLGNVISEFRGSSAKLVADAVLQNLIDIKAKGATFGALSESELSMLERAATELRPVKDKNGEYTGQFAISEDRFKEILDTMQTATMKTFIASRIGAQAYKQAGYITADADDVRKAYNALIATQPGTGNNQTNFYQQDLNPTLDVIRREEGFSPTAYRDSTGTWTIGYGNTTINGRPVQASDRITREQGEELLRESVTSRYSTGVQAVNAPLSPTQQAALVSFEYNLGPGVWQTPTGQRILSLVSTGNYAQAGQLMQQYNKSRNASTGQLETNPVLVARRAREAALLLG